jgi:outer membrane protein assembly factor BamB
LNKPKIQGKKTLYAILFVLILTLSTLMAYVPTAKAADITTYPYLAVNPSIIGVGDYAEVTVWLEPLPPTDADVFHGFQVTITKPDGTTENRGPLTSSTVGSQYFVYTPDSVGIYYFQFTYPGETFPNGVHFAAAQTEKQTLTVQQDKLPQYQDTPLPADYWDRPINGRNRLWASIAGNWLMRSYSSTYGSWDSGRGYNPYSTAIRAPHIVWTKEIATGGLVGGEFGTTSYYAGLSYEPKLTPPVIMNGKMYYNIYPKGFIGGFSFTLPGFVCVDLNTGEELWRNNEGSVTVGQIYNYVSGNQMGGNAYLWDLGPGVWKMYDAFTGDLMLSLSGAAPASIGLSVPVIYGEDGSMRVYFLDGISKTLMMWNSTKAFEVNGMIPHGASGVAFWRPIPGTFTWATGIQWVKPIPALPAYPQDPTLNQMNESIAGFSGDTLIATIQTFSTSHMVIGYSLTTGEQLWANTVDQWSYNRAFGEGYYAEFQGNTRTWAAFDAATGAKLWTSQPQGYPWGTYVSEGKMIANGKLYSLAYDGYVHAYDMKTGNEVWKFASGISGRETPYGTYPFYYGPIVADGVCYVGTGEHSPTQPLIRGEKLFAVDDKTGTQLWSINGFHVLQALADGYLISYNGEDNRIYCYGKGKSATDVSAPQTSVASGKSILISGMVTDQSPAQPGTPAISDADMSAWMEFQNMQQQCPANANGVPVKVQATNSAGQVIDVGTVTSDSFGRFASEWAAPGNGLYKITASFAGSDSYWASSAETFVSVKDEAVAQSSAGMTTTDLILLIAVIIAIIIGVLNLLDHRRMHK